MGLRRLRVCLSHYLLTACKCVHQAKNVQMFLKSYRIDLHVETLTYVRLKLLSFGLADGLRVVGPLKSVRGNPKVQMISMRQTGRVSTNFS